MKTSNTRRLLDRESHPGDGTCEQPGVSQGRECTTTSRKPLSAGYWPPARTAGLLDEQRLLMYCLGVDLWAPARDRSSSTAFAYFCAYFHPTFWLSGGLLSGSQLPLQIISSGLGTHEGNLYPNLALRVSFSFQITILQFEGGTWPKSSADKQLPSLFFAKITVLLRGRTQMPNGPKEHNFQLIKVEVDLESGKIHPGRGLQPEKELRPLSAPTERDMPAGNRA